MSLSLTVVGFRIALNSSLVLAFGASTTLESDTF